MLPLVLSPSPLSLSSTRLNWYPILWPSSADVRCPRKSSCDHSADREHFAHCEPLFPRENPSSQALHRVRSLHGFTLVFFRHTLINTKKVTFFTKISWNRPRKTRVKLQNPLRKKTLQKIYVLPLQKTKNWCKNPRAARFTYTWIRELNSLKANWKTFSGRVFW